MRKNDGSPGDKVLGKRPTMSEHSQSVVFPDIGEADADAKGSLLRGWLIDRQVIAAEPTDCVLGEPEGHAPGANHHRAHGLVSAAGFLGLATCGVTVNVERRVFDTGGNGVELRCPSCGFEGEGSDEYFGAVQTWAEGEDDAPYACPACGAERALRHWSGEFAFGFGALAVTFWNWPHLTDSFVRELEQAVQSQATLVRQRL